MSIDQEFFLMQQDRMRVINENNARFVKLEETIKKLEKAIEELELANGAQITLNQHFFKQLGVLETRLKKEETKPLVTIPDRIEIKPKPFFDFTEVKPKPLFNFFRRK